MDKLDWFVKALTATSPPREGEPVGTADTSRVDNIRWQYVTETEKVRPTQSSCNMLTMTRRGRHWRLYNNEIQKGGKPLLYEVQCDSERQTLSPCMVVFNNDRKRQTLPSFVKVRLIQKDKLCHLVWCWIWHREAVTAVLCDVECDREANFDGRIWRDNDRRAADQGQRIPSA